MIAIIYKRKKYLKNQLFLHRGNIFSHTTHHLQFKIILDLMAKFNIINEHNENICS